MSKYISNKLWCKSSFFTRMVQNDKKVHLFCPERPYVLHVSRMGFLIGARFASFALWDHALASMNVLHFL